jgi:hypothetical protein
MQFSFFSILGRPNQFFTNPAFRPVLLLYGGTYLAAKPSDTFHSFAQSLQAQHMESNMKKLCTITSINLCLSLYKDAQFAKNFGLHSTPRPRWYHLVRILLPPDQDSAFAA